MSDVIKTQVLKGVNLFYIPDSKYKTVSMTAFLNRRLKREEATKNALLSKVLKRGTKKCKNIYELNVYADNLYGALYDVNISKKAHIQSILSSVNFLSDEFAGESITEKCVNFMLDLLYSPNVSGDGFDKEVFNVEKQNLKDDIEGLINDKRSYANFRCIEEMCKGEENSVFEFGYLEDLDAIDEKELLCHYRDIITKSPLDIFVVGNIDVKFLCKCVEEYFSNIPLNIEPVAKVSSVSKKSTEVKYVEDVFDVAQGKLAMGFKTGITIDDPNYYALILGNSIFGSGAHSRLFNTVREKLSLCYYASSMTDKFRGIMLVSSGIEFCNFEKARNEIEKQLHNIKNGDFTDDEFEVSKNHIINSYRSIKDSAYSMKDYYRGQCFSKNQDSIDEAISKIEAITKDDVVKALENVELDTVYFLKGKEV